MAEKPPNVACDGVEVALQKEVAAVQKVYFGLGQIALKGLSPRRGEDLVVASPDGQQRYAGAVALAGGDTRFTTAAWIVLAAAVLQGTYHFASKPLLGRYSALEVAAYATWMGTVLVLPFAPAALHSLASASPGSTASGIFLGLLPSALGFVLWGYAIARSSVTTATSVLYLVPVIALAVSFAWLGEVPTLAAVIGGALAVVGVVITRLPPRQPPAAPSSPLGDPMTTNSRTDLIRRYFDLARRQDAAPYLAQFAPDSLLEDEGVQYRGASAIAAWHRQAPPVVYTIHDVTTNGDGLDVRVDIAGDFPSSPIPLTHHFVFTHDEHIGSLVIHP